MSDSPVMLVRTDSTTVAYDPYLKKVGLKLSPLGRDRRIERWQTDLIKEYNEYYDNELFEYYKKRRLI